MVSGEWGGDFCIPNPYSPSGLPVAHGGNHATCSTWGNLKTAVAPQDRAGLTYSLFPNSWTYCS
jgi:hypothetical protein